MLILSQCKTAIVTFDNVFIKMLTENFGGNKSENKFAIFANVFDQTIILGKYRTLNRAKEIVDEIFTLKINNIAEYIMPEN